ncbi:hypothetical protein [Phyllobacterium zundukense]|uniref:Uncharacterized protein n=1 Tax=Phyllobacterium zundukense TaxID=1867719 RepID=A0A2N9VUN6_9HYPH|nr:hypothetical protein [Phyllobacterium zundukense]ATU95339.1 hypothetical protein BLM14_26935 [Phyllobacterium zundukense]PIO43204.1 hypothetical protein B5P45_19145 [Phyllobacterium zundukense]
MHNPSCVFRWISFYHGTFPLLDILFGLDDGDEAALTDGITGAERLVCRWAMIVPSSRPLDDLRSGDCLVIWKLDRLAALFRIC